MSVNALHPASLMNTKMAEEAFGYTMSTFEEGSEARADRQAYDGGARQKLWNLSEDLCRSFLAPLPR